MYAVRYDYCVRGSILSTEISCHVSFQIMSCHGDACMHACMHQRTKFPTTKTREFNRMWIPVLRYFVEFYACLQALICRYKDKISSGDSNKDEDS